MLKKIIHQKADLYYHDIGSGEPVILLHGFAEDSQIFDGLIEELTGFRILIPDLPGSGKSRLTYDLRIDSMAEAVAAIINHETVSEAVVIGHSMGGYITLALVEKHPNLVKAFGLFHSSAFADSEEKKKARRKLIRFIHSHGTHDFLKQSTPGLFSEQFKKKNDKVIQALIEKYREFNPASLTAYYEAMIMRPDRTHVLLNSSKPVLFIIGKHDNAIPFEDSMKLCHLPSLSYIHILEDSGHMGMLEEPENCISILKSFLSDVTVTTTING